ncbi:MAG: hypothetical protein COB02_17895 [Candidatus Cloacimonadota bacterium]|nr:MAG: hypothetical protein COB02_17895 [Candidatus Cloacimonadota bacterium]
MLIEEIQYKHLKSIAHLVSNHYKLTFEKAYQKILSEYFKIQKDSKSLMIFCASINDKLIAYARILYHNQQKYEPSGWYLMGVIVEQNYQRQGIALALTKKRIQWVKKPVYCFINSNNLASIKLHQKLGFQLIDNDFNFPDVTFNDNGHGQLYIMNDTSIL